MFDQCHTQVSVVQTDEDGTVTFLTSGQQEVKGIVGYDGQDQMV